MDFIAALDLLHNVRFKRCRAPTPNEGQYLHDAWNMCARRTQSVATLGDVIPLNAIAEAVRVGVLVTEVWT